MRVFSFNTLIFLLICFLKGAILSAGNNRKRSALNKYLEGYSECETQSIDTLISNINTCYDHLLVIPVYDESFDALSTLINGSFNELHVLFILVVNCPVGGDSKAAERTFQLWKQLLGNMELPHKIDNITYAKKSDGHGLILIDRCREPQQIPNKQGVGLARKTGADLACALIAKGVVNSRWIHSTDADVFLPSDYFCCTEYVARKNIALVYPFKHIPESGYEIASELYDISLRYYVESLHWAGSHYAYHSIGSLIAVDFEAYAKVRGFPKRAGGEDFYLLNKLAKVGELLSLEEPVIKVSARPSHRVPFGTGPALNKIVEGADEPFVFYHPKIFKCLKQFLTLLELPGGSLDEREIKCSADIFPDLNSHVLMALDSLDFSSAWCHAKSHSGGRSQDPHVQFIKHMTTWFDAFRTLKFIHFLRNNFYSSIALSEMQALTDYLSPELNAKIRQLIVSINHAKTP